MQRPSIVSRMTTPGHSLFTANYSCHGVEWCRGQRLPRGAVEALLRRRPGPASADPRSRSYFVDEPGDVAPPLVVPGAIWDRAAPGDPSERVESEASEPLVPPVPKDPGAIAPPRALPPGETRESPVPGAI